jgi:hypothetical protein
LFSVRSVNTASWIEFSELAGDYFVVKLRSPEYRGIRKVYAYTDASGVAQLFRDAAQSWRGWSGTKSWRSLEGELELSLRQDALGHVTLEVAVGHDDGNADPWRIRASLGLEAGQLEAIASEAERFF